MRARSRSCSCRGSQPDRAHVYGWLLRTATREAIKFDQRARRTVALLTSGDDDGAAEPADERARPELRVELSPPLMSSPRPE
jgi:DNA-directed RNA polymerase specialized sigma24 family protein